MNNYFTLLKILMICGSNQNNNSRRKVGNGKFGGVFSYLIILAAFAPMISGIAVSAAGMYAVLAEDGQQGALISMGISYGLIATLVSGFTTVIVYFYTSSDLQNLLALPLTPSVIVAAKFTLCLLQEYLYIAFSAAPLIIGFGLGAGAGVPYWIIMVLVLLLLPVTPLVYGGILAMLIMKFFKKIRNKNTLTVICFSVSIVLSLVIIFMQQSSNTQNLAAMQTAASKLGALLVIFPNIQFAENALLGTDFVQLLIFFATVSAAVAIFLLAAKVLYFQGAIGMTETSDAGRRLTETEAEKRMEAVHPLKAYAAVERKKIQRAPTVLLYGMLLDIILPVTIIASLLMNGGSGDPGESGGSFTDLFTANSGKPGSFITVLFIFIGILLAMTAGNYMTSSSISREGKEFYVMKTIPVSYTDQIRAKVRGTIIFGSISGLIAASCLAAVCIANGMPPFVYIYALAIAFPGVLTIGYIQIFFDLAFPKLIWENENAAVSGYHQFAGGLVGLLLTAVILFAGFMVHLLLHAGIHLMAAFMLALMCAAFFLVRKGVCIYGEKRIRELS